MATLCEIAMADCTSQSPTWPNGRHCSEVLKMHWTFSDLHTNVWKVVWEPQTRPCTLLGTSCLGSEPWLTIVFIPQLRTWHYIPTVSARWLQKKNSLSIFLRFFFFGKIIFCFRGFFQSIVYPQLFRHAACMPKQRVGNGLLSRKKTSGGNRS